MRNDQQSKTPHFRIPFDVAYLIAEWVGIAGRRGDLQSLALVNHLFSDAAGLWIWKNVILRAIANSPFTPTQRRLDTLLGRLDQGKMVANLQLLFDANLPEAHVEYFRIQVGELLMRSNGLKGLTVLDTYGDLEFPSMIGRICPSFQFRLAELAFHLRITPELWDFVLSQPTIRRLVLDCQNDLSYTPGHIPTDALPQLEAIVAPIDLIMRLLPGRPVKCVVAQSLHTSPSQFQLLWQAVKDSATVLTSLSVRVDSAQTFEALLQELPQRTPRLRFLGVDTGLTFRDTNILPSVVAPLRSLELLECIRWESKVSSPGYRRINWRPNPVSYAGPSLQYVQHEVWTFPGGPGDFEGIWELVSAKKIKIWKLQPYFIVPRDDFRRHGLVRTFV